MFDFHRRKCVFFYLVCLLVVGCNGENTGNNSQLNSTTENISDSATVNTNENLIDGSTDATDSTEHPHSNPAAIDASEDGAGIVIPSAFTSVQATAGLTLPPTPQYLNTDLLDTPTLAASSVLVHVAGDSGAERIGIRVRKQDEIENRNNILFFDVSMQSYTNLASDLHQFGLLSNDLSTVAWSQDCQAYSHTVEQGATELNLNLQLNTDNCLFATTLSDGGETLHLESRAAIRDEEGNLVQGLSDRNNHGPLLYHLPTGKATSLSGNNIGFTNDFQNTSPYYTHNVDMSFDGKWAARRVYFLPNDVTPYTTYAEEDSIVGGDIPFDTALVVVNAVSGEVRLVDQQREQNAMCRKCPSVITDLAFSGNGAYIYYLRRGDDQLLNTKAPAFLHRYDIKENLVERVPVNDAISSDTLAVDYTGNHVAYKTGEEFVLLKMSTGERVVTDSAILNCESDQAQCEFGSYRIIHQVPLWLSHDGSTMAMLLVPERADIETPQNVSEVYLLDTSTKELQRAAPEIDVWRVELSHDGSLVALQKDFILEDYSVVEPNIADMFYLQY